MENLVFIEKTAYQELEKMCEEMNKSIESFTSMNIENKKFIAHFELLTETLEKYQAFKEKMK